MSKPVEFRRRALRDIREAAQRYDSQQPGLGVEFEADIEASLAQMEQNARLFRPYYQVMNRVLLDRFPYKIFFLVEADRVQVVRVLHDKRDHPRHLR